jgi:patatin-like phospholipase/acyl hydrolase
MNYKYKILSIDGGGIRGIIPAMILAELERCMGASIAESFDMIAGTSTGGILSLGLTKPHDRDRWTPQYSASDLVDLYSTQGKRIFHEAFPGKTDEWLFNAKHRWQGKDAVLTEYLGETPIDHALKQVFITSYDTQLRKPVFFISNPEAEEHDKNLNFRKICTGFTMKQVAMATSAAPTFFEPYQVLTAHRDTPHGYYSLIDGAAYANNPTLLAIMEARMTYFREHEKELPMQEILIVSLGTGSLVHPFEYEQVKGWGKLQWIQPFINIVFDGQSEAIDSQLGSLLQTSCATQNYYRFQLDLDEEYNAMDDASDRNIQKLKDMACRMIDERELAITKLCKELQQKCREKSPMRLF